MTKSEKNQSVIENFILYFTRCSKKEDCPEGLIDPKFQVPIWHTPEMLYDKAKEYIKVDHWDGKDGDDEQ